MKRHSGMKAFLMLFLSANLQPSFAVDCNSPPTGYSGSWARAYAAWCQRCGGTYNPSNQSCRPGSNWGGSSPGATPSYNDEAERQAEYQRQTEIEQRRQRELEEQHKGEAEAARKKQEEFQHDKQEALQSMKGSCRGRAWPQGLRCRRTGSEGHRRYWHARSWPQGSPGFSEQTQDKENAMRMGHVGIVYR